MKYSWVFFFFLCSSLSRYRSEKHPSQMFWVQKASRNGTCRPIFDLLGEGGIEKALPLQSQLPLFSSWHLVFSINWDASASYHFQDIEWIWQFHLPFRITAAFWRCKYPHPQRLLGEGRWDQTNWCHRRDKNGDQWFGPGCHLGTAYKPLTWYKVRGLWEAMMEPRWLCHGQLLS